MKDNTKELILNLLIDVNDWIRGHDLRSLAKRNSVNEIYISELELREIVKDLRFGGHPIIASPKGYKYTKNQQELQDYISGRKLELESELNILRKMEGKW